MDELALVKQGTKIRCFELVLHKTGMYFKNKRYCTSFFMQYLVEQAQMDTLCNSLLFNTQLILKIFLKCKIIGILIPYPPISRIACLSTNFSSGGENNIYGVWMGLCKIFT
jgi:hypothetical protein